jgi:hypothetical protein
LGRHCPGSLRERRTLMLKVWRGKGTIFAECTDCGSYGSAAHLQIKTQMAPEIAQALERHTAHMMSLRGHYQTAAQSIAPNPDGKVTELATACPWCSRPEEVEIETLPDGVTEPDYALGRMVAEAVAKSARKGK